MTLSFYFSTFVAMKSHAESNHENRNKCLVIAAIKLGFYRKPHICIYKRLVNIVNLMIVYKWHNIM